MRATRTVSRAARAIAQEHNPISRIRSSPYICTACQTAAAAAHQRQQPQQRQQPPHHHQQTRPFTSSHPIHTNQSAQAPPTHYDLFPQTFPTGPPPSTPFTPNLRALRQEYLKLQSQAHPDLAPPDRKAHYEALSSRINEAYKVLQDPLRRAQYLLAQQGIDVEDESAKLSENELLMEVMEAREAVDEVEDEEGLVGLREENNARMERSVQVLDEAFAKGDLERAAQEAIRLRYWCNIAESIQGWERGRGGGPIHH